MTKIELPAKYDPDAPPTIPGDYDDGNTFIDGSLRGKCAVSLTTEYLQSDELPEVVIGSQIECRGSLYVVETANESIDISELDNGLNFLVFNDADERYELTTEVPVYNGVYGGAYCSGRRFTGHVYYWAGRALKRWQYPPFQGDPLEDGFHPTGRFSAGWNQDWGIQPASSFATPSGSTTSRRGCTLAEGNLITCDSVTGLIYKHDGISSTILDTFTTGNSAPADVEWTGTELLVYCNNDVLYVHTGVTGTIDRSITMGTTLHTIMFDGTDLWGARSQISTSWRLYHFNGISDDVAEFLTFPYQITSYGQICYDGENLVVHYYDTTINGCRQRLHDGLTMDIVETNDLSTYIFRPEAATIAGGKLVVVDGFNADINIWGLS